MVKEDHLHDYLINIIRNQRRLQPRSLVEMMIHHLNPEIQIKTKNLQIKHRNQP